MITETSSRGVEQMVTYMAGRLLEDAQNDTAPPFGLIETCGIANSPVTSFDQRDPFGHLGKTVADTLAGYAEELHNEVPAEVLRHVQSNVYPGSLIMGYLLAKIVRIYSRELPDQPLEPAILAQTARLSYLDIVKKFASHGQAIANAHITQNRWIGRQVDPFSLLGYLRHYPLSFNPFADRHFDLGQIHDKPRVTNNTLQIAPWETTLPMCPAAKTHDGAGMVALRSVWNRMVDVAEENHYTDPQSIEWALRGNEELSAD